MKNIVESNVLSRFGYQAESLLEAEKKVLEMIATRQPLSDTLNTVALNYEAQVENALCSILLVNEAGTHIKAGAGPSLPKEYNDGIYGEPIGPAAGSCGTAVFRKERVIVSDIATDPLWKSYRELALGFGLKACWSTPIIAQDGGKVLATFAIYYKEVREPDSLDFELIGRAANQVKIAVEQHKAEEQLKKSEEKYRTSLDRITDGFASLDKNFCLTYINKKCGDLLNLDPEKKIGAYLFDEFPSLKDQPFHRAVQQAIEEQHYVYLEDYNEEYDRWFEDHIYPSTDGVSIYFRDITVRKKSDKELRDRELQFRRLTSTVPTAIFQTDLDGLCTFVNDTWLAYSGMEIQEAMGPGWLNAIHPDDRANISEKWQQAVAKGKDFNSEMRFRHKNGNVIWLTAKAVALYDSNKHIYGHIGMATDITSQKKINEVIEENESRYRTTLERITDGFVALDHNWCYTYMNREAGKIFNRDPDKVIGKHFWTEFPEGVGQPFHKAYEKALSEQEYVYLEEYYPPYDKWFENHIYPSAGGLSIYFKDVTDRKKSETALRESEEKFRGVVEQSLTGVYIINGDYFTYVNPQFAKIFGYRHEEMLNNFKAIEIVHKPDRKLVRDIVTQRLGGKNVESNYQFRGIKKDGSIIYVEVFGALAMQGGVPVTIGTLLDITDKEVAERALAISENQLRTILDTEPECVKILNRKGELLDMNPAGLAMIEADSLSEVKGKSIIDLVNEPYRDAFKKLTSNVFNGLGGKLEFEITGIKGGARWLETNAVPLLNSGRIVSLLGVTRDITEKKTAATILQGLQKEKEAVLNRISDKMVSVDKLWRYTFLNDAALQEHPMGREATLGKVIWDVHPEMLGTLFEEKYREALRTKKTLEVESFYKPLNKWFAVKIYPSEDGLTIFYHDVSERKSTEQQLQNYTKKLRDLTIHLQNVREEERSALSRELHDELGQQLTAIKMDLSWMNLHVKASDQLPSKINDAIALTNDAVKTVRRINSELRPSVLDDLGLFAALEWQMNEFGRRFNVDCQIKIEAEEPALDQHKSIAIFRIFQESLTNIGRHAKATKVRALIRESGGRLELTIRDNGVGFDRSRAGNLKSFGILGMTERAMMMNGALNVDSTPGKGTNIKLTVLL